MKIKISLIAALILFPVLLFGQGADYSFNFKNVKSFNGITSQPVNTAERHFTGNLSLDSKIAMNNYNEAESAVIDVSSPGKKSPFLAGLLSFALPGAGEVYAGDYLKGAIFAVVEAAIITTAIIYNNKGNDQTDYFQNYADKNWSVVRYAEYVKDYVQRTTGEQCSITINPDESLPPWQRVNWDELNNCESVFSHQLHPYGSQQYYELIGKYPQYSPGWVGFTGDDYHNLPPIFHEYSLMRGKANDYYDVATKAVIGIYINHFLSILDAVWSTSKYNKSIAMKMRLKKVNMADRIDYIPTLNISYNF